MAVLRIEEIETEDKGGRKVTVFGIQSGNNCLVGNATDGRAQYDSSGRRSNGSDQENIVIDGELEEAISTAKKLFG